MTPADFDFVRKVVKERAAISLDETKAYLVESRLEPLAQKNCGGSLDELLRLVRTRPWGELHRQVVEAMTTNETYFFRDGTPFEALRKEVLPAILKRAEPTRQLAIWSAACSSGQEAYSISMILDSHFAQLAPWSVQIVGTDISSAMVERARAGIYSQLEVSRGLPAPMLVKYFERAGVTWRVKDVIRRRVTFDQMNLAEPRASLPKMDVVFLRNVLIYFDDATKRKIVDHVWKALRPDGALFLGAGETMFNVDDRWASVPFEKTLFYRPKKPG